MQELKVKIKGMHCGSCEVLIEQRWKKLEGIHGVKVNYARGEATIHCSEAPSLEALHDAVKTQGYQISWAEQTAEETQQPHLSKKKEYLELGAIVLVLVGLYVVLKQFNLFPDLGISEGMGYGLIFLLGLVAATTTCMAVTGGLLLTVATKYNSSILNFQANKSLNLIFSLTLEDSCHTRSLAGLSEPWVHFLHSHLNSVEYFWLLSAF